MNLLKYTIRRNGDEVPRHETQIFNYNSNLRKYSSFNPETKTAIPDLIPFVEFEDNSSSKNSLKFSQHKPTPFLCSLPASYKDIKKDNVNSKELENEFKKVAEFKEQQLIDKFKTLDSSSR